MQRLFDEADPGHAAPLSREFLLARSECCHSQCDNCPYPLPGDAQRAAQPAQSLSPGAVPSSGATNAALPALTKRCPACGETFTCQNKAETCWCSSVTLSDTARQSLRQRYTGCLCPACLIRSAGASPT